MKDWLLNSFKLSMLGQRLQNRNVVMLEDAPQDTAFLDDVLDAIDHKKYIKIEYQNPYGVRSIYTLIPLFVRLFKHRWYIIGQDKENDKICILAINRILSSEILDEFVSESIETEAVYKLRTGKEFTIVNAKDNSLEAYNKTNEKTTRILMKRDEILTLLINKVKLDKVRDVTKSLNRKTGFQEDSYIYAIVKALREQKKKVAVSNVQKVNEKPFVLIIDEINRGDASKIFGELFYAIDPGYRGKTENLVQTQYQNLVSDTDIFAKGFYVPENVYILATMNDIDRSVECMDFAMRRRFVWKEITPSDTDYMLSNLEKVQEAQEKMAALNAEIAKTEGLGGAYQIGPAYFKKLEKNGNDFDKLWTMNIEPLLKEYLRGFRDAEKLLNGFKAAYYGENESKEVME